MPVNSEFSLRTTSSVPGSNGGTQAKHGPSDVAPDRQHAFFPAP